MGIDQKSVPFFYLLNKNNGNEKNSFNYYCTNYIVL